MFASAQRVLVGVSAVSAAVAAASALTAAWEFVTSPFNNGGGVELYAADAIFLALLAVALSALVIASLVASWSERVRLGVHLASGSIMTALGCVAALMLDPTSMRLQDWLGIHTSGEAMSAHAYLFAPWIERLAALSWVYAACGVALVLTTTVLALTSARVHRPPSRATPAQ